MAAPVLTIPSYLHTRPALRPARLLVFVLIAVLHVAAIAGFVATRPVGAPTVPPPIMVSFLGAVVPQQAVETPPPPKPEPPRPQPRLMAAPSPAPAAIEVPPAEAPPDEAPPQEPQPAPAPAEPGPPAVVPPNFIAAYLNNPAPAYPPMSIRLREEGTVLLLVLVNAGGTAEEVRVDKSSGFARLDSAAVEVVKKRWRFVPAKQGDQPVAAWVKIPLSFELKKH